MYDLLVKYAEDYEPLTEREELELKKKLNETGMMEIMYQHNARYILSIMKSYIQYRDRDDVAEVAIVALTKAFHLYMRDDITLIQYINNTLRSALYRYYVIAKKHITHTTMLELTGESTTVEQAVEDNTNDLEGLNDLLLGLLNDKDKGFMYDIYHDGMAIKEAGAKIGLTPSLASKLHKSNLAVMREKAVQFYSEEMEILHG